MASVALALHRGLLNWSDHARMICRKPPESSVPCCEAVSLQRLLLGGLGRNSLTHVHGIWTPFEYAACSLARGAKLIVSPHGALEPWAFASKKRKKFLAWHLYQRRVLERADLLIVNSDQERRTLRNLGLRPPIGVIANGVDLTDCPSEVLAGRVQRERIVLFLSRLSPKKGLPALIDAWTDLSDRRGFVLHIHGYGDDAYRGYLDALIRKAGIAETVKILPPVFGAQKWQVYGQAMLYILPSYSENFGITVAEAMIAGLPVITTRATPWNDISTNGIGWLVDPEPTQISSALKVALSAIDAEGKERGRRARAYATARYLWAPIVERYRLTYEWLAVGGPIPEWVESDVRHLG